ncbi:glycerol-3-phosphate 1-O-acyltransferase PlsY [Candidatus Halobeggiatoa sp. HSG11]|nr:glycerol-3-phosphate 1-O-acyltransferase PlsY [Candidatus Halobeggiatoa sp. HSG11]
MVIESLLIVLAYLLGSVSGAMLISKMMGLSDPRTQGSGNPGATNVLRYGGKKAALITLILDILKGVIAVLIAKLLTSSAIILAGVTIAVFVGHLYPIFFNFQGGKGVATAFGALVALVWQVGLAALVTWLSIALLLRYSSLAAIVTAISAPLYMFWFAPIWEYQIASIIISILLIWRHRSNIHKLMAGQESKIGK